MSNIHSLSQQLAQQLIARGLTMATAESCTGGGVGARLTDLAGSSAWFSGGIISYSNQAKQQLLGVSEQQLLAHGAVSEQVVVAMAQGACNQLQADLSVAVSGVAGPSGGSVEKPVGTVWIAWCRREGGAEKAASMSVTSRCYEFSGDRLAVREATIKAALDGLLRQVQVPDLGFCKAPN
ncbi:MAG TPA: damage-inducible protein CinA [Oceanospirillaceae bacterium]|nr:damage-inducible protein CinA [Oceanospirillaceae bacterium]